MGEGGIINVCTVGNSAMLKIGDLIKYAKQDIYMLVTRILYHRWATDPQHIYSSQSLLALPTLESCVFRDH